MLILFVLHHIIPPSSPQFIPPHLLQPTLPTTDLLQQALLVISQKYPVLGLKLCWTLFANMADYSERRVTQVQQAASVCLLMQLELAITGHSASDIFTT